MGGEESAGFTMEGHVPEKDGPLACLLLAELVATTGRTLGTLLADLFATVGPFWPDRADTRLDPALAGAIKGRLAENPDTVAGLTVQCIDRRTARSCSSATAAGSSSAPRGPSPS